MYAEPEKSWDILKQRSTLHVMLSSKYRKFLDGFQYLINENSIYQNLSNDLVSNKRKKLNKISILTSCMVSSFLTIFVLKELRFNRSQGAIVKIWPIRDQTPCI